MTHRVMTRLRVKWLDFELNKIQHYYEVDGKGKNVRNALFGVKCIDGEDEEDEEVSGLDAM